MKERIKGRKNYPTEEVDPLSFLNDNEIRELVKRKNEIKFTESDYNKLFNCVHCGECETELLRIELKEKYIEEGNTFNEKEEMLDNFHKFRSPYPSNKMRIKKPREIPNKSDTLFFMGCLSTIRIPKYTEHALEYLLNHNIDFTILDNEICCGWHLLASGLRPEFDTNIKENAEIFKNFKEIICLCPACFYLFNTFLKPELDKDIDFHYITEYIKPANVKRSGNVSIQHLCQLMNRGNEGVEKQIEAAIKKSGYNLIEVPHWCCGGGTGWMGRTSVIESVARKRMTDFDREEIDYVTTYCPSCWWILRRFSKQCKIKPKTMDIFELLL